jgi:cbb3-type cytochrome oxidase subunit 3
MGSMADDPLNLLRIAVMLVFIAAFLGILVWLVRPGAKRRGQDAAMIPLRDDPGPGGRP